MNLLKKTFFKISKLLTCVLWSCCSITATLRCNCTINQFTLRIITTVLLPFATQPDCAMLIWSLFLPCITHYQAFSANVILIPVSPPSRWSVSLFDTLVTYVDGLSVSFLYRYQAVMACICIFCIRTITKLCRSVFFLYCYKVCYGMFLSPVSLLCIF